MKVSLKPGIKHQPLVTSGRLALAVSLLGFFSAAAQQTNNAVPPAAAQTSTNSTASSAATPQAKASSADDFVTSPTDFNNWVTLGVGDASTSGNKGAFEHQEHMTTGASGGIQDFHWQEFEGKSGMLTVDGHAMAGNDDYAFKMKLADPNLGYVEAGFTQFRTWYNGTGGFFPVDSQSFSPFENAMAIDRGSLWAEAALTLPDKPSLTLRYEHDYRQGMMDSTSWGDNDTGTGGTPADRKTAPSFQTINETRDIVTGDVKDKFNDTDVQLGLRYEIDRSDDSFNTDFDPGSPTANRYMTQENDEKNQEFNAHGYSETLFSDKVTFSMGGALTYVDTDLSGSQIYGPTYNAAFSPTYLHSQSRDEGYTALTGGGNMSECVANMNLMLTPIDNLVIVPALRVEHDGDNMSDSFTNNTVNTAGGTAVSAPTTGGNDDWYLDVAQSLEARYTGFRNWSLYASGNWSEDSGNDVWNQEAATAVYTPLMNQDWDMLGQKYTIGANWYPLYRLNFGAQYYYEDHDYSYEYNLHANLTGYPGYLTGQTFKTHDMNIRATWRILDSLSLVSRYDFQLETVNTAGNDLSSVQSANVTSHTMSANASWTPLPRMYVQAGGSYVLDSVETPATSMAGVETYLQNGMNDYWTIDTSVGYAIDDRTDLQLQYSYYQADDYSYNSSFAGMPYGAGDKQHSVTATLTRDITKALQVGLKYGFYTNRDQTSGGLNNYTTQLVYANMTYRF